MRTRTRPRIHVCTINLARTTVMFDMLIIHDKPCAYYNTEMRRHNIFFAISLARTAMFEMRHRVYLHDVLRVLDTT